MPTLEEGLVKLSNRLVSDVQAAKGDLAVDIHGLVVSVGKPWSAPRKSGFLAASFWPTANTSAPPITKSPGAVFTIIRGAHRTRVRREMRAAGEGDAYLHATAHYASEIIEKTKFAIIAGQKATASFEK